VRQRAYGVPRVGPTPWRRCPGEAETRDEAGFTLIELIIVTLIIPVIIGAITLALISVFSLQAGTSGRIADSGDAQVVSSNFETDVQNASLITSASTGLSPQCTPASPIAGGTQVLGLQSPANGGTVISYEDVANGNGGYSLMRYVCQGGANSSPVSSNAVSSNVRIGQTVSITCDATLASAQTSGATYTTLNLTPLPAAVNIGDHIQVSSGGTTETYVSTQAFIPGPSNLGISLTVGSQSPASSPGFAIGSQVVDTSWASPTNNCGANSSWISTASVTGVTFATAGAGKNPYAYNLVAVPRPSSTPSQPTTVSPPNSSCVFATGSGTYTSSLCFVDFSSWNSYSGTSSSSCPGQGLAMSAGITNTSYTLTFCMNVQSVATATGASVTGPIGTNAGYNGVAAVSFPTYPEAFLGNNKFYTVSSTQHPALYQQNSGVGKTTTVTITNIEVSDTNDGTPATGWELVTGDAETTDAGESLTWTTSNPNTPLNLLPNTPSSPVGDACSNPVSPSGLMGVNVVTYVGSQTVTCASSTSDTAQARSGTVMLESPAPSQLTVTMVGTGLEAMFLGVLLPSGS
jgi:prepilin-type N-terminal cleavage/methylation domain-containing protein